MRIIRGPSFFLIGLAAAMVLAYLAPQLGTTDGPLPITALSTLAVFIIFFNQGVTLPRESLRHGLTEWKLHGLVQLTTFVFFPLMVGLMIWLDAPWCQNPSLRRGFLYLSILPTTVASATALTILAKGHTAGALFNATLSSLLAVLIVPSLSLIFLIDHATLPPNAWIHPLRQTALSLILPFLIGQIFHRSLASIYQRHATAIRHLNTSLILLIIWFAFCRSFAQHASVKTPWTELSWTLVGTLILLGTSAIWLHWAARQLKLAHPSRIAAFFCGNQKSLAVGLPLAITLFGSTDQPLNDALLLLPLILYHTAQLMLGSSMVPFMTKTTPATNPPN